MQALSQALKNVLAATSAVLVALAKSLSCILRGRFARLAGFLRSGQDTAGDTALGRASTTNPAVVRRAGRGIVGMGQVPPGRDCLLYFFHWRR